jgi:prolyl-tRNA synthetase
LTPEGLDAAYEKHYAAYKRIFDRCGLEYVVVEAHSGAMGGSQSHEFMVVSDAGEDFVVKGANYAANLEKAVSVAQPPASPDPEGDLTPEEFHTPGQKSIAEIAAFTGLPATSQMKSLVMVADGKVVLVMVRGDHQLSETKFASVMGAADVRPAHPEEIRQHFGADAGSLGPVGVKLRILVDEALRGRRNMIAGANKNDYHLRHVTPGEDFQCEYHDLRQATEGDTSVLDGSPLTVHKTVEIGHIFKLGYKYSKSMGLRVLDESGKEITPIMGSYGIGIERILCAAVELYNDKDGIVMPPSIAPFTVVVTPINFAEAAQKQASTDIYSALKEAGLDAILDDRDERPGVKFKDADLIGIPYRINVGKKVAQGFVEAVDRRTKLSTDVAVTEAAAYVIARLAEHTK